MLREDKVTAYPECRLTKKGREYVGKVNKTETGKECLRWDSHPYEKPVDASDETGNMEYFVNGDIWSHKNYCRNPSAKERPWCFVADSSVVWEYCDIPMCPERTYECDTRLRFLRVETPECKVTQQGGEYVGKNNATISGSPCLSWSSERVMDFLASSLFSDGDEMDEQHNFCRNPDGKAAPWCMKLGRKWEFCDVPFCPIQNSDPCQELESQTGEKSVYPECRLTEKGREYVGKKANTETGKTCLRWDENPYGKPWDFFDQTKLYEELFINQNPSFHKNYCRNPGIYRERPWCFVSDPVIQWEYCDIPLCKDRTPRECKLTAMGGEYVGKQNTTISGFPCQRWLTSVPRSHSQWNLLSAFPDELDGSHNFCRNPTEGFGGPWCYSYDSPNGWEYCNVPFCPLSDGRNCTIRIANRCITPLECKETTIGMEYKGTKNVTVSGLPCQPWLSHTPNKLSDNKFLQYFPDEMHPSHNFCRNPDGYAGGPWCYNGLGRNPRWEACDIKLCQND
ncbi:unnamed protein product [Darwinula stevensoni]|uniref:Kringle domain-containing protein n=1 Tax=Darwinula stevensoni TaxID=69355 RepID=A0A7R8XCH6_9CRUS|nr:unnamed protein product [Darwinula stevensoni]CAG0893765.1 unnamed protein product [Darwinula stevensoni]